MHDVQVQIRCQRCGAQMELTDPAPEDAWPPQQFWECPKCGRHFWTTYPPPKPAVAKKPAAQAKPAPGTKTEAPAADGKPAPSPKPEPPEATKLTSG